MGFCSMWSWLVEPAVVDIPLIRNLILTPFRSVVVVTHQPPPPHQQMGWDIVEKKDLPIFK